MCTLTELYNLRQTVSIQRQARHAKALKLLDDKLRKAGVEHPYGNYPRALSDAFMKTPCFYKGSRGYLRKIHDHEFIYRLSGIKELAGDKGIRWHAYVKPDRPPKEIFNFVNADFERAEDWLPLNRYAGGSLTGYRNITFWTTSPPSCDDIISYAHLVGMTNNWLKKWSVVLQCRVKDLSKENNVRVPTAIDAYTELIFHPTQDQARPTCGTTIKLSEDGPLAEGTSEFVLGPIEASKIKIRPLPIDNHSEPCIHSKNPELWDLLQAYYNTLP